MDLVARAHIQDHGEANTTEKYYWGYASRILPCTKDTGTCEYLEAVYTMHETSMLYTFILWAVIGGVLLIWTALRFRRMGVASQGRGGFIDDLCDQVGALKRSLLPDAPMRWLFGRVSRLQVVVLAVMLGYLLVFSLVGITYKTWITPISGTTLFNTRTGLGGWSDRIGALAYALTPFTILLCMRESVLSLLTAIPYQHFNFLHRWLGRVIFLQSFLHTLAWTLVEGKFYQPQPSVYAGFMAQQYVIFGVVAMFLITWLTVFSMKSVIAWTGYEFFKITHWVVAVLYVGACWGHWDKLWCWMVPSLFLVVLDQAVRFLRMGYLHYTGNKPGSGSSWFQSAQGRLQLLTDANGSVIRLDIDHDDRTTWQAGQHFYLTFPSLSIWQSHPFTVASIPSSHRHTYLLRVRSGQTSHLARLADENATVPVILAGPYGQAFPSYETQHVLAVAGGTGVTFTLPILQAAMRQCINRAAVLEFVWVVRKSRDLMWLAKEIDELRGMLDEFLGLRIKIFVSREESEGKEKSSDEGSSNDSSPHRDPEKGKQREQKVATTVSSIHSAISLDNLLSFNHPRYQVHFLKDHHPSIEHIMGDFRDRTMDVGGVVEIVGSGPEAMGSDLRGAVAKVQEGEGLKFYWDSRE
ncbi:hypothetical protein PRZ48_000693 [Zasmidium cellare]|uniref:ferric-chelate reductase (NADPH) n=1 Tax=Zasmidium cellare TaxID=395010 RepID=A0ABR0EZS9_ZASCE|nr:hypothetical protein PRZ48_000693 [Zasmidium cellare]